MQNIAHQALTESANANPDVGNEQELPFQSRARLRSGEYHTFNYSLTQPPLVMSRAGETQ